MIWSISCVSTKTMAITQSMTILPCSSPRSGPKAIYSLTTVVRLTEPHSAENNGQDDDIDLFNHPVNCKKLNDYKALGIQDGWFNVKYNAEYKVGRARRGESVGSNPKTLDPSLVLDLGL